MLVTQLPDSRVISTGQSADGNYWYPASLNLSTGAHAPQQSAH